MYKLKNIESKTDFSYQFRKTSHDTNVLVIT